MTTAWDLLAAARTERVRLREVVAAYYPSLRAYLTRKLPGPVADVEDVLHDFLVRTELLGTVVDGAKPEKGKFRWYLATAALNFARDRHRRRSGDPLPDPGAVAAPTTRHDEADEFHLTWVTTVVREALAATRAAAADGRVGRHVWDVLKARHLEPVPVPGRRIEEAYALSQGQVDGAARTARKELRDRLNGVLGLQTVGEAERREAYHDLFQVIYRHGGLGDWGADLPYLDPPAAAPDPAPPGAPAAGLAGLFDALRAEELLEAWSAGWPAVAGGLPLRALLADPVAGRDALMRVAEFARARRAEADADPAGPARADAAEWLYLATVAVARVRHGAWVTGAPVSAERFRWAAGCGWGWAELAPAFVAVADAAG